MCIQKDVFEGQYVKPVTYQGKYKDLVAITTLTHIVCQESLYQNCRPLVGSFWTTTLGQVGLKMVETSTRLDQFTAASSSANNIEHVGKKFAFELQCVCAVSYTHLDVYKRQV